MRERETDRPTETQTEGEAGSMQGAQVGLDPQSPGSRPGLKVVLSHPGCPGILDLSILLNDMGRTP